MLLSGSGQSIIRVNTTAGYAAVNAVRTMRA